jgi:hypothetical protein
MDTSTAVIPSVRAALEGLIDYAGLFPPAKLDMASALSEYDEHRNGPYAWMLGRLIVPASRIDELLEFAHAEEEALPLSVIVDAGNDPRTWFANADKTFERISWYDLNVEHIVINALEVPLPPLVSERETYEATIGQAATLVEKYELRDVPVYIEPPRNNRLAELLTNTLEAFWRYDVYGKIRCGGLAPEDYPSVDELARYIWSDREYGGGFKATAGLHHPIRHYNEAAGVTMHGFLNLLFASAFADVDETARLETILADTDPTHFAFEAEAIRYGDETCDVDEIEIAREHFVAYGSCSFSEPVEDLIALSILPKA